MTIIWLSHTQYFSLCTVPKRNSPKEIVPEVSQANITLINKIGSFAASEGKGLSSCSGRQCCSPSLVFFPAGVVSPKLGARSKLWPCSPLSHSQISSAEDEMETWGLGRGCMGILGDSPGQSGLMGAIRTLTALRRKRRVSCLSSSLHRQRISVVRFWSVFA